MKPNPITEELEWQLFDWLEGNLSAEEAAILEKTIQNNPEIQQYVAQFKATYLNESFSTNSAYSNPSNSTSTPSTSATLSTSTSVNPNNTYHPEEILEASFKQALKKHNNKFVYIVSSKSYYKNWSAAAAIAVLITTISVFYINKKSSQPNYPTIANLITKTSSLPSPTKNNQENNNGVQSPTQNTIRLSANNQQLATLTKSEPPNQNNGLNTHPLLIATSLPTDQNSVLSVEKNKEAPYIPNMSLAQSTSQPIDEETIVMISSPQKPKEIAQMAWINVKEMMRQGKLPKIILKPQKSTGNQQLIPDMNIGIQVNQMSFVRTVSYHPTQN